MVTSQAPSPASDIGVNVDISRNQLSAPGLGSRTNSGQSVKSPLAQSGPKPPTEDHPMETDGSEKRRVNAQDEDQEMADASNEKEGRQKIQPGQETGTDVASGIGPLPASLFEAPGEEGTPQIPTSLFMAPPTQAGARESSSSPSETSGQPLTGHRRAPRAEELFGSEKLSSLTDLPDDPPSAIGTRTRSRAQGDNQQQGDQENDEPAVNGKQAPKKRRGGTKRT